jgi:hypothetical protein
MAKFWALAFSSIADCSAPQLGCRRASSGSWLHRARGRGAGRRAGQIFLAAAFQVGSALEFRLAKHVRGLAASEQMARHAQ